LRRFVSNDEALTALSPSHRQNTEIVMPAVKPRRAKGEAGSPTHAKSPTRRKSARSSVKTGETSLAPGDFAKQQVARLESMFESLVEKANDGELGAIDRILKIVDRLDRYQGFSPSAPEESDEDARQRILRILSDVDARRVEAEEESERGVADAAGA
jgi:hypothetical protein